ncbi:MAG: hypothetical protein M3Q89_01420, partial [Verrucomicrobiota bacterium]|nr:hypothetical protein [Verrucomicrobiota bacterium]
MEKDDFFDKRAMPRPFDPKTLDRSVIAIPLLEKIEAEVKEIEKAKERWPNISEQFTGAMFFNPEFPGGLPAARKRAGELLAEAKALTKQASVREKVDSPAPESDGRYSFTRLSGQLIRKLLALNSDLTERPILRVVPSRFEVIIDPNLDLPEGRDAAKAWIITNIESAKTKVGVVDDEQRIHERKSALSHQYIFARLEGRVIKELVRRDAKNAQVQLKAEQNKKAAAQGEAQAARQKVRGKQVVEAKTNTNPNRYRAIFRIWPDFAISSCIMKSLSTVKADAAQTSFSAHGRDIA